MSLDLGLAGRAAAMFAVTNVDDLVLLAVFFGRAAGRTVVAGQFLGFGAILAASVAGALGAGLLPDGAVHWLGVLPVLLGIRAAWQAWRAADDEPAPAAGVLGIAAVCFANGGDNVGVYVPAFAATGPAGLVGYTVVSWWAWPCGASPGGFSRRGRVSRGCLRGGDTSCCPWC